ncbi:MAG: hypothetical protein WC783_00250 [Candidatus Paceibacterota bacterium]|jgi:hypothetical protein
MIVNKDNLERIQGFAKNAFKDHILTEITSNTIYCHKEGTITYSYYVTYQGGYLIIYGDIGHAIFRVDLTMIRSKRFKGFCESNYDYIFGKLLDDKNYLEYDKDEAIRIISDIKEISAEEVEENYHVQTEQDYYDNDIIDLWDYDAPFSYSSKIIWIIEALKKLGDLLVPFEEIPIGAVK